MSTAAPITPDPKKDDSVPPPKVIEKSQNPASKPITVIDVINMIVYLGMVGAGIYYGWKLGRQYALRYWILCQTLGEVLGKMIRDAIAYMIASLQKGRSKPLRM